MAGNGRRRPPRPRIEMLSSAASPGEAAAVVAAIERFLTDTAPVAEPSESRQSPWLRAALEEGISARRISGYAWGAAPERRDAPSAGG